jgi:hypothetical protein
MTYVDIELRDLKGRQIDTQRLVPVHRHYPLHRILTTSRFGHYPQVVQAFRDEIPLCADTLVAPGEKITLMLQPALGR